MLQPKRIEIPSGAEVVLEWEDDSTSRIPANVLRDACPCAECRQPEVTRPPADPVATRIGSASLVGAYALNVVFTPDGHATGIYPFDGLRRLADEIDQAQRGGEK